MALDVVLLEQAARPWLRFYRWDQRSRTIGYFERPSGHTDCPVFRRPTGGGTVLHGGANDTTFALGVPRRCDFAKLRPATTYTQIHAALQAALEEIGISVSLARADPRQEDEAAEDHAQRSGKKTAGGARRPIDAAGVTPPTPDPGERDPAPGERTPHTAGGCFQNPVQSDLLAADGGKIAGGAQRRNRHGLLHQGSIKAGLSGGFPERFATALCPRWQSAPLPRTAVAAARELAPRRFPDLRET